MPNKSLSSYSGSSPDAIDNYFTEDLPSSIFDDFQKAGDETEFEVSENTRRNYQLNFSIFKNYCEYHDISALPADPRAVISFIGQQKELIQHNGYQLSQQTLYNRIAAIRFFHIQAGFRTPTDHPLLLRVLRGISRNQHRNSQYYDQQPIMDYELSQLLKQIDLQNSNLIRIRDKALLTLGFQGGFRRSELANLQYHHIHFLPKTLRVKLPFSKSNQVGNKEWKDLPYDECHAAAPFLKDWFNSIQLTTGHVFRSISRDGKSLRPYHKKDLNDPSSRNSGFINGDDVYRIVKKYCKRAGLSEEWYGAHSLRSGCVTQLHENNRDSLYIMGRTGHTDPRSLRHYLKPK